MLLSRLKGGCPNLKRWSQILDDFGEVDEFEETLFDAEDIKWASLFADLLEFSKY